MIAGTPQEEAEVNVFGPRKGPNMADVNLSKAVRSNLLSLQSTAASMAKTQERLATGLKVNSALDNPSNFFTASALNSRAGDMANLLDGMSSGIKTIEAADNGLKSITKTVETMQSTLRQARQDKSFQTSSFDVSTIDPNASSGGKLTFSGGAMATATQFDMTVIGSGKVASTTANYGQPTAAATASLVGTGNIAAGGTNSVAGKMSISYQGTSVTIELGAITAAAGGPASAATAVNDALKGTALEGKVTAAAGGNSVTLTGLANQDGAIQIAEVDGGTTASSVFGTVATVNTTASTTGAGSDAKTQFSINGTDITLDRATTGASLASAVAETNKQLAAAGQKFQAYDASGKLGIRATSTDSGALAIGGADANLFGTPAGGIVSGTTSASLKLAQTVDDLVSAINSNSSLKDGIKASNDNGKLRIQNLSTEDLTVSGTTEGGKATGVGSDVSSIGGNDVRKNLVQQFNDLRDQLDKFADDASFNGINLLRGDKLKLTFNETGTSTIEIQAKTADGSPASVNNSALGIDTVGVADFDSDAKIDAKLDVLKSSLDSLRSQASTFGSNLSIVENRQDFTKNMINTLETGAANLTLADTNEEAANLLALQTRQQLSSTALSMASQADQAVLRLF